MSEEYVELLEMTPIWVIIFFLLALYEFWASRNPANGCLYFIAAIISGEAHHIHYKEASER